MVIDPKLLAKLEATLLTDLKPPATPPLPAPVPPAPGVTPPVAAPLMPFIALTSSRKVDSVAAFCNTVPSNCPPNISTFPAICGPKFFHGKLRI